MRLLVRCFAVFSIFAMMFADHALAAGSPASTNSAGGSGFSFTITPYGWGPSADGTIGVDGHKANFDLPIDNSINYLEAGGMLGLEARKDRWGLLFDGTYMELEDNASTPGPFFSHVDVTYQQATLDLGVFYRVYECDRGWLDVLAGGRYMYFSTEVDFAPDYAAAGEISDDIVDDTSAAVRNDVEGATKKVTDQIANELATKKTATINELADAARDRAIKNIKPDIAEKEIHDIVSRGADKLSEGLDGRKGPGGGNQTRRTLADAAQGAFETRIDRKLQQGVDRIKADVEARRLANAIRDAVADNVRKRVLAEGAAIEGNPDAIRATVKTAFKEASQKAVADLKKTASADVQRELDRAEEVLAEKITDDMEEAADADVSDSIDWVDPYVGLRTRWLVTQSFYVGVRGDIGGFGIGSASDLAWQLFGGVGYEFNKTVSLEVGWRYMDFDHDGNGTTLDITYSGATAGLAFNL